MKRTVLRPTLLSMAIFVALCGAVLVALGTEPVSEDPPETSVRDHINQAQYWATQTERTLHDGNYGDAEDSIVELRNQLTAAEAALDNR